MLSHSTNQYKYSVSLKRCYSECLYMNCELQGTLFVYSHQYLQLLHIVLKLGVVCFKTTCSTHRHSINMLNLDIDIYDLDNLYRLQSFVYWVNHLVIAYNN